MDGRARGDDEDHSASTRTSTSDATIAPAPEDRAQRHGVELDAGHDHRRRCPSRAARSRSRRRCPTSTPTRSSPRWTATRATTCSCCVAGGAQGLRRQRARRCRPRSGASSPTGRDLAQITSALSAAPRRTSARVDPQLPALLDGARPEGRRSSRSWSTPPTRSSASFANQDAQPARGRSQLLPSTLPGDRQRAGQDRHAGQRARARRSRALRPGGARARPVAAPDAALPAPDDDAVIRDQLRPFARDALPDRQAAAPGGGATSRRRRRT